MIDTVIGYFTEFHRITDYLIILLFCLLYSFKVDKDYRQTISLSIISIFYVFSPLAREFFQSIGFINYEKGFFEFYSIYEILLCLLLIGVNQFNSRGYYLYFVCLFAALFNFAYLNLWEDYSVHIYPYYAPVNNILMDIIVLGCVALKDEKRLLMFSIALILSTNISRYLF